MQQRGKSTKNSQASGKGENSAGPKNDLPGKKKISLLGNKGGWVVGGRPLQRDRRVANVVMCKKTNEFREPMERGFEKATVAKHERVGWLKRG